MPEHEAKRCPRCGAQFECRSGTILRCQCQPVRLEPEHIEHIATRYGDCLCAVCLEALRTEYEERKRIDRAGACGSRKSARRSQRPV